MVHSSDGEPLQHTPTLDSTARIGLHPVWHTPAHPNPKQYCPHRSKPCMARTYLHRVDRAGYAKAVALAILNHEQ
jgi:hypothetical protein